MVAMHNDAAVALRLQLGEPVSQFRHRQKCCPGDAARLELVRLAAIDEGKRFAVLLQRLDVLAGDFDRKHGAFKSRDCCVIPELIVVESRFDAESADFFLPPSTPRAPRRLDHRSDSDAIRTSWILHGEYQRACIVAAMRRIIRALTVSRFAFRIADSAVAFGSPLNTDNQ